ncbi:redoxin domain-containing protein [Halanaerobiaceae bacterium Z-7014]|uniref:Redoxin domain-containing protein n=1 Tax=Halonatronomonas betaini TaxID=2778430 RepID=A0A931APR0_9FIRM|nr:redoxin domain-containing protein [Halonatronomonas betaini]MBF8435784.1 redoxin domain-containing protein [Halonatronomonas betaini]
MTIEKLINSEAPQFNLKDQDGNNVSLSDLKGQKVLLSFHPLAWTGICQTQMEDLEGHYSLFEEYDTVPLGVSVDATPCKKAWAKEIDITNLKMLSDFWPHGALAKNLGIFRDEDGFSERANILIDQSGKIVWAKKYEIDDVPDLEEVFEAIKNH